MAPTFKPPFGRMLGPGPVYATFVQTRGRRYNYDPQPDITPLEIARIVPLLIGLGVQKEDVDIDDYLERHGLWRHFKVQG